MKQIDLFAPETPPHADEPAAKTVFTADPEKVRGKLHDVLDRLHTAETLPFDETELRYQRTVFPQMSRWLPEAEAADLCARFETEIRRLAAA
ncbi:hypothetical protein L2U69_04145 [Zavarzinia compransoris]|uniref:hypothetical protein n=1 Tax=Zavarzinia marina TaxID=2911065 RepID=UPI001F45507B|nr:hypothetical protein [Zavarzinia marina]MCF4164829.1 hypothetical protein [Zavarzinia marina]